MKVIPTLSKFEGSKLFSSEWWDCLSPTFNCLWQWIGLLLYRRVPDIAKFHSLWLRLPGILNFFFFIFTSFHWILESLTFIFPNLHVRYGHFVDVCINTAHLWLLISFCFHKSVGFQPEWFLYHALNKKYILEMDHCESLDFQLLKQGSLAHKGW